MVRTESTEQTTIYNVKRIQQVAVSDIKTTLLQFERPAEPTALQSVSQPHTATPAQPLSISDITANLDDTADLLR